MVGRILGVMGPCHGNESKRCFLMGSKVTILVDTQARFETIACSYHQLIFGDRVVANLTLKFSEWQNGAEGRVELRSEKLICLHRLIDLNKSAANSFRKETRNSCSLDSAIDG